jgi:hypothetical protein
MNRIDGRRIQIGRTTKSEVVKPDLVFNEGDGETVTYRPARQPSLYSSAGGSDRPFWKTRTETMTIEPGLGKNDQASLRPQQKIHIRYDAHGIVQDVKR